MRPPKAFRSALETFHATPAQAWRELAKVRGPTVAAGEVAKLYIDLYGRERWMSLWPDDDG